MIDKKLSDGARWLEHIQGMRDLYEQPEVAHLLDGHRQWLDIPYGNESGRQKLNIYTPHGSGSFPVIIWIHGGGWYTGHRSDRWLVCGLSYIKYGFAVVSIGYRLADEAVFPKPVEDVIKGIEYIEMNGAEYGLDISRLGISGGSAGANIAANACLWHKGFKAAQLNCAPLEFSTISEQFKKSGLIRTASAYPEDNTSYESMYLGGSILELPKQCELANPANYLEKNSPPFLLMHGKGDDVVPYQQSVDFVKKVEIVTGEKGRAKLILIEDGDHDSVALDKQELFLPKLNFFKKYLL